MSIHLVGGGWSPEPAAHVYGPFVREAVGRHARDHADGPDGRPRVVVLVVRDGDQDEHAARLLAGLAAGGAAGAGSSGPATAGGEETGPEETGPEETGPEATKSGATESALPGWAAPRSTVDAVVVAVAEGAPVPADAFAGDVDGIVVGGGLTPAYRDALEPHADAVRALVRAGVPYLGFSAGAAIAADHAIVGGWRIGGVEVSPQDGAEDLDEVTVLPGLGLVDVAIDVHAAQWGSLSRLVAATEAGLVPGGVAIDEDTLLVVGEGGLAVAGRGSVWRVVPSDDGVRVSTLRA